MTLLVQKHCAFLEQLGVSNMRIAVNISNEGEQNLDIGMT